MFIRKSKIERLQDTLNKVLNRINSKGWSCYDPLDFKALPLIVKLNKQKEHPIIKAFLLAIYVSMYLAPYASRRLLGIKPDIQAGGVGHLASAYLELYQHFNEEPYLPKVRETLQWLKSNAIAGYSGYAWGFTFDWHSKVLIPARTPLAHTSITCAMPFIDMYELTHEKEYLLVAESTANMILTDLNCNIYSDGLVLYTYTPFDDMEVMNINLDIALFMYRLGLNTNNFEMIKKAQIIASWFIKEQQQDGSWFYFSKEFYNRNPSIPPAVDNYHTGMILRSLFHLSRLMNNGDIQDSILSSLEKGLFFYLKNLFGPNGKAYLMPHNHNIINVYGCIQAILLLSELVQSHTLTNESLFKLCKEVRENVIQWTTENMISPAGDVWHEKRYGIIYKLSSLRWGLALIVQALTCAIAVERLNSRD